MNNFIEMSDADLYAVVGGDWEQFGKALTGTLLIATGVIVSCVPGGALAGVGMVGVGIEGLASTAR